MNNLTTLNEVFIDPGFTASFCLNNDEVIALKEMIFRQYRLVLSSTFPETFAQREVPPLERYHEIGDAIEHKKVWSKECRCLCISDVESVKKMGFFSRLKEIFGDFKISDVVHDKGHDLGREEIYWRLVRPNRPEDVGALHADWWFHDLYTNESALINGKNKTVKVWIPLICEPGQNGLQLVPNSHLREWKYSSEVIDGVPRIRFEDYAEPVLINTPPGNALIFNERMLHGGVVNKGHNTRISMEISVVLAN